MAPGPPPHLLPDFDPTKSKIPELRSILLQEDVPYNGAANKGALVALYEQHVRHKAPAALAEWKRVRPSTHGILDGESSGSSLAELDTDSGGEADAGLPKPKKDKEKVVKIKAGPRKSKAPVVAKKYEDDEDDVGEQTPRKATSRKSSVAPSEASNASGKPAVSNKRRPGSAPPEEEEPKRIKADVSPAEADRRVSLKYESGNESPFSDYNPFQSGNEETPDAKARRRKSSMGPARRQSHLPGSEAAGSSKAPRKSMPATLPSSSSSHAAKDFVLPPVPALPTPGSSKSLKKVGSWVDSDDAVSSSPAVHKQLTGRPAPSPGTPGVKYMAPIEQVKKSPPEMQKKLAEFYRALEEKEKRDKAKEEEEAAQRERATASQEEYEEDAPMEVEEESLLDDADEFDPAAEIMDLDDLERELEGNTPIQVEEEEEEEPPRRASSSSYSLAPVKKIGSSPLGRQWQGTPSKEAFEGLRNELRNSPFTTSSTPSKSSGRALGDGRRRSSLAPSTSSAKSTPSGKVARRYTDDYDQQLVLASTSSSSTVSRFSWASLFLLLFSYLLWWREEKVATGFCDTSSTTNDLLHARSLSHTTSLALDLLPNLPRSVIDILDKSHLRPSCTPCPTHGVCTSGTFKGCQTDYVVQRNPLELGGLVPVAPYCVPDTEKIMAVAKTASEVSKMLRQRRGQVLCKGGLEKSRKKTGKSEVWVWGMRAGDILDELTKRNELLGNPYSESMIDEIGRLALVDLQDHGDAIYATEDGELWLASKTAEVPLSCRARLAAVQSADKHKSELGGILATISAILWARRKLRTRKDENQKVKELVKTTLNHLQRQERLHYTDPVVTPTAHVAPSHLRDLVLQAEHSPIRRQELWKRVEKVVESNANVRAKQVEVEGEPLRAWQWSGISTDEPMAERSGLYPSLK